MQARQSSETAARWEHFPHDADIGVRGFGATAAEAFEQAAAALTAVITDPSRVAAAQGPVVIERQAPDYTMLLADWLNALIYEMAVRDMLFSRFEVTITGHSLQGRAWGENLDVEKHQPAVEIKGATYTGIEVAEDPRGHWTASCIVDV